MLLNSHKDQRKEDKLVKRFIGSYAVEEYVGKGIEHSWNRESTVDRKSSIQERCGFKFKMML